MFVSGMMDLSEGFLVSSVRMNAIAALDFCLGTVGGHVKRFAR